MNSANNMNFVKGMGMGLIVGTSLGLTVAPRKKTKNMLGKALHAAGELADNISETILR
ncbi:MAG: hypothetical protein RR314_07990 [Oscillospiraceae bacterium]